MMRNFFLSIWLLFLSGTATAFQFPKIKFIGIRIKEDSNDPQILVQNGPEEKEKLRLQLEKYCDITSSDKDLNNEISDVSFRWEPSIRESYEVADVIFQELAKISRDRYNQQKISNDEKSTMSNQVILSFPAMTRPEDLDKLSAVLQSVKCKELLGLGDVGSQLYPLSPSPYLTITLSALISESEAAATAEKVSITGAIADSAISSTKEWVNNFLGNFRLCPYTSSISRAAVGLTSIGVPVGGVHVRLANTSTENAEIKSYNGYNTLGAAELVSAFWSEVVTLMNSTQDEWATSLVVCPEFDTQFEYFIDICDSIVEPTVVATQATDFIGRAWFHPQYDADAVGHSEVIAGHAVPHKMVEGFMKTLSSSPLSNGKDELEYHDLVEANNRVRQTPHATINILRRSQLNAAAEYERGLGEKRPKANSIYVRNAVRLSEAIKSKIKL